VQTGDNSYDIVENFCEFGEVSQLWYSVCMPKRTYQPKTAKRAKVHGFRARMSTKAGQIVLKRRRNKARTQIAIK